MFLAVAVCAPLAVRSGAENSESLLSGASLSALQARQRFAKSWEARPPQRPPRKLWHTPRVSPAHPSFAGPLLGSFKLAERLDAHRNLLNRQLGTQAWDISMASDPNFKVQYLALSKPDALKGSPGLAGPGAFLLKRIDDLNRLRGDGVVVDVDSQTHYRVKVSINIFNPVRGSTVNLDPVNGTRGPSHKIKTGEVLDQVKGHSFVFRAGGKEFWLLYGTDVDPKTDALANTRSLVFVNEAGLDSKAWPVAEAQLAADSAINVDLGGTGLTLVRTADGTLRIHAR